MGDRFIDHTELSKEVISECIDNPGKGLRTAVVKIANKHKLTPAEVFILETTTKMNIDLLMKSMEKNQLNVF